jgi:hypothetical protein
MIRVASIALVLGAAACVVGVEGNPQVLLTTGPLDGGTCPVGGQLVSTGVDSNGDGVLQASEVTSSVPVCGSGLSQSASVHIQSGETSASFVNPGWTLAQGTGDRLFYSHVAFPEEFASVPSVVVALRWVDSGSPQRVEVSASATDTKGFMFTVRTWDASLVNGVIATWIAYAD